MPRRTPEATPEQFVRVWQRSKTVDEVARALRMTARAVYERGRRYRAMGVELKYHGGDARPLDVEELNRIARESAG